MIRKFYKKESLCCFLTAGETARLTKGCLKMKTKIILALLLAIASAASITACGQDGGTKDTEAGDGTTVSDSVSEEASDTGISDGLPEKNYGGRTFTVATDDYMVDDYMSDGETGDIINDAVYRRNTAIEDRFGIKLEVISDSYTGMSTKINQMIQSGDDSFDLIAQHACTAGTIAINGGFMNWYDIPYVDLEKPWWSKNANKELSYKNKAIYLAGGDYALSLTSYMYAFFFDKVAVEDYGMTPEYLYGLVRDGKWTLDTVADVTKDIYKDLNGNDERDIEDFYGIVSSTRSPLNTFMWSCDNPIMKADSDGIPQLVYYQDKTSAIVEKVMGLFFDNTGGYTDKNKYTLGDDLFAVGRAMMVPSTFSGAMKNFRENKNPFGVLPYPKYDEAQTNYYTMSDGSHALLSVPVTVKDTEFTGIITEALCAESWKNVVPKYYETVLKVKLADDADTSEMIDIIGGGLVFDYGYIYDNGIGFGFTLQNLADTRNRTDIASFYAKREKKVLAANEEMFAKLDALIGD